MCREGGYREAAPLPGVRRQGVPLGKGVDGMPMPHASGAPWLHPIFSGGRGTGAVCQGVPWA